jgi:hypothetical protein
MKRRTNRTARKNATKQGANKGVKKNAATKKGTPKKGATKRRAKTSTAASMGKVIVDLRKNPEVRKLWLKDHVSVLQKYGIAEEDFAALVHWVASSVQIQTPWPPPGEPSVKLSGNDPTDVTRGEFELTVTGKKFKPDFEMAVFKGKKRWRGTVTSRRGTNEITGTVTVDEPGEYGVAVGTLDEWGKRQGALTVR